MPSNGTDSTSVDSHFASSHQLAPATRVHQHPQGSDNFAAPFMSNPAGATDVSVPGQPVPGDFSLYVDKVANDHQLTPKFRVMLHHFKETLVGLPQTFWAPLAYQEASALLLLQELEGIRRHIQEVHTVSSTIRTQLVSPQALTSDQQFEVTVLCKRMIIEAHRTDYDFADEALAELRRVLGTGMFLEVFASSAWTKTLRGFVRRQASYARNSFRRFLRDSVLDGKKKCGLTKCARDAIRKFAGDNQELTPELLLHLAILRRFVREHPELLDREEQEPEDESGAGGDDSHHRKRRRGRRGRVSPDENDFWTAVSAWFTEKDQHWGRDVREGLWRHYLDDCITEERRRFPEDRIALIAQGWGVGATVASDVEGHAVPTLPEFAFTVPTVSRASPLLPESASSSEESEPVRSLGGHQHTTPSASPAPLFRTDSGPPPRSRSSTPASVPLAPLHPQSSASESSQHARSHASLPGGQEATESRPRPRPRPVHARPAPSTIAFGSSQASSHAAEPGTPSFAAISTAADQTVHHHAGGSAAPAQHVSLPSITSFTSGFSLPSASSSSNGSLPSLSNVTGAWQFNHSTCHETSEDGFNGSYRQGNFNGGWARQ